MGITDELITEREPDPVHVVSVLSPSDPENMKRAFALLVDSAIEHAPDVILDWGTARIISQQYILPESGQEAIQILLAVRGLELNP